jgi:hypothetical protein
MFPPLFYPSKPPRPPNRRLHHVRPPTTVQKIYTQTYETSIVIPPTGRSVFCIFSTSFHCHNIACVLFTDEQLQKYCCKLVIISEQFCNSTCNAFTYKCNKSFSKKISFFHLLLYLLNYLFRTDFLFKITR